MEKPKDGCVAQAKGPISIQETMDVSLAPDKKEEPKMIARVGKPAPDFEANAFYNGGFKNIKLSDYKNQWVLLCFYPGDFTFV